MSLLYKSVPFLEAKATSADGSEFEGYCAVFNNVDSYGDVILPGAFAKTLDTFLANGQICYEHGEVIGIPLDAREDAKGLFIKGRISDTARGRDAKTLLKDKVFRKMSIGYRTRQRRQALPDEIAKHWQSLGYQPTPTDQQNLQDNAGYLQFLAEIQLYEASPVGFPANTQADITGVKALRLSELKSLIQEVKAGRKLAHDDRGRLAVHHAALAAVCKDLGDLLTETDPEAEDAGDDAEKPADKSTSRAGTLAKARAELALLSTFPNLARAHRR